jgi:uncharacterized membrane protein
MIVLYIYALFALTTAFTSLYEILMPVINRRSKEGLETDSTFMTYIIFFCMAFVLAPLLFLSCILPSMGERFRSSLYDGLYPKE